VARRLALTLLSALLALTLTGTASAHDDPAAHRDTRAELGETPLVPAVRSLAAATGTTGSGLPVTWCGTERTSDDSADAAFDVALPQFKVVYAYAADQPDRFASWRDAIQADASVIGRFLGDQSGGTKAPRFDMGTSCGPEYVDIQVVHLPGPRSAYIDDFRALTDAVATALGFDPGDPSAARDVFVFADQLSSLSPGSWWGLGSRYTDDSAGAGNASNYGGLFAALWIPLGEPAPGADPNGWWPEGMLHEMTHNLGAVQWSAPHTSHNDTNGSGYGHCWDGFDVMCYHDGPLAAHAMTYDCPQIAGVMNQVYDCGADDYFNVAPPGGSYLATHWNVYDSRFLGGCAALAPACSGTPAPLALPVSTAPPVVSGTAQAGQPLAATAGSWTNAPYAFSYRWQRGDNGIWTGIPGATGASYPVTADDVGQRLRAVVVATNDDGSSSAASVPTDIVAAVAAAPGATPAPVTAAPPAPVAVMAAPTSFTAPLKLAGGRRRGRSLGSVVFVHSGGIVHATLPALRLARGRYVLKLCLFWGGGVRCVSRAFAARRSGRVRPPKLAIDVPVGSRVALTVAGRGFSARTAKRPSAGVYIR
jgi:hypothetical protein